MKTQTTGSLLGLLVFIAQPTGSHAQTHFTIGAELAIIITIVIVGVLVIACCISLYRQYHTRRHRRTQQTQPREIQQTEPRGGLNGNQSAAAQQGGERRGEIQFTLRAFPPTTRPSSNGDYHGPPGVKAPPLHTQLLTQPPPAYSDATHYPTYTAVHPVTTEQQCDREPTDKVTRRFERDVLHSNNTTPSGERSVDTPLSTSLGYERMPADGSYVVHNELVLSNTRGEQHSSIDVTSHTVPHGQETEDTENDATE